MIIQKQNYALMSSRNTVDTLPVWGGHGRFSGSDRVHLHGILHCPKSLCNISVHVFQICGLYTNPFRLIGHLAFGHFLYCLCYIGMQSKMTFYKGITFRNVQKYICINKLRQAILMDIGGAYLIKQTFDQLSRLKLKIMCKQLFRKAYLDINYS